MKKLLALLATLALSAPVLADPVIDKWKTYHSMGCMLVRDCEEGVTEITSIEDIKARSPQSNYTLVQEEFDLLLKEFKRIGIGVYLAKDDYFPRGHRAVYHTVGNNFFINAKYVWDANLLLELTRHEGWHAAQDCMAGDINNNNIAVILQDGVVPRGYRVRAEVAYASTPAAIPWETEAIYASERPYLTRNALAACQAEGGDMWDVWPPTPMTGEWLIKNGFWDGVTK